MSFINYLREQEKQIKNSGTYYPVIRRYNVLMEGRLLFRIEDTSECWLDPVDDVRPFIERIYKQHDEHIPIEVEILSFKDDILIDYEKVEIYE